MMGKGSHMKLPEYRKMASKRLKGIKRSRKTKKLISKNHRCCKRENNPSWKGGRKRNNGYVYIHCPHHPFATKDGYVYEHRLVVEEQLGVYLAKDNQVHHINGQKDDNRPENLICFKTVSAHVMFEYNGSFKQSDILYNGVFRGEL